MVEWHRRASQGARSLSPPLTLSATELSISFGDTRLLEQPQRHGDLCGGFEASPGLSRLNLRRVGVGDSAAPGPWAHRATPGTTFANVHDAHATNFAWLLKLRWGAAAGQLALAVGGVKRKIK